MTPKKYIYRLYLHAFKFEELNKLFVYRGTNSYYYSHGMIVRGDKSIQKFIDDGWQ